MKAKRTAVVTGATSGIGLATAMALAGKGIDVIGVGRSTERCEAARRKVTQANPGAGVEYRICDLSSQAQIRRLAREIEAETGRLDILVNVAGVVASQYTASEDGIEMQFAVNHLAPFLLTHELLPLLKRAPQGRVLTVSSNSHYGARLNFSDLFLHRHYSCLGQYKRTKMCNILFTSELNRRLGPESPICAFAVDPGLVKTEIGLKNTSGIEKIFWRLRMRGGAAPEVPAACILFLATNPSACVNDGVYWHDCMPKRPDPYALRQDVAKLLWESSEKYCGLFSR